MRTIKFRAWSKRNGFYIIEEGGAMKITVWIGSPDNNSFREGDIVEVPDDATEEQIRQVARETAFEHIEWGYYKTEGRDA